MMTPEERREYLLKVGKPGRSILDVIDRLRPFVQAMNSDMGIALLEEDITAHAALLNKIYNSLIDTGTAEQQDAILLKLLHARMEKIYQRLQTYAEATAAIKTTLERG